MEVTQRTTGLADGYVAREMNSISEKIMDAVDAWLEGKDIEADRPVDWSMGRGTSGYTAILSKVMNAPPEELDDRISMARRMQESHNLSIRTALRALIAAAVTKGALDRPLLKGSDDSLEKDALDILKTGKWFWFVSRHF